MPTFFQITTFVRYWLEQVSEHSLHSPFLYDLYTQVIKQKTARLDPAIELQRKRYIQDTTSLTINDLGAGSASDNSAARTVSSIAQHSVSPAKYSTLYARLVAYSKAKNIVELGTSLGINTLYLASATNGVVTTFEGACALAALSNETFDCIPTTADIRIVEGDIDKTLPAWLDNTSTIDFVFADANHRYAPTLKYFNLVLPRLHSKSIVVLDDIHYSAQMERAWHEIRQHELVYTSVDLYRCGLLFFEPSLNKQHVVLQF